MAKLPKSSLQIPVFWPHTKETTSAKIWGWKLNSFFIHRGLTFSVDKRAVAQREGNGFVVTHAPTGLRVTSFDTTSECLKFVKMVTPYYDWENVNAAINNKKLSKRILKAIDKVKGESHGEEIDQHAIRSRS